EEGAESVQLPFKTTQNLPEDKRWCWWRKEPKPLVLVHVYDNGDDLKDQNQRYSGRTSMKTDGLDTGDLSLILTDLQLSDSATYTCSIREHGREMSRSDVQLQVKGQQQTPTVETSDITFIQSKVMLFFVLLHRAISILGQSSCGCPGFSCVFWRSFFYL
uniref:Ig-like domain-containing protein n=1 Tax=Astatotilapia calliptera TaxID=8154 RepID=A0A3P8P5Q3_ASTCA